MGAPRLVVAGLSVRALAQAATRDGYEVHALDLFGDADTRAASVSWQAIGDARQLRIDPQRLLNALAEAALLPEVMGWVAGAGFDGQADLLTQGEATLRLLGCDGDVVRRCRDPRRFFELLDAHGMAHPAVSFERPSPVAGWLRKDGHGSGGWHIRPARDDDTDPPLAGRYWQREAEGRALSMTLLAVPGAPALLLGVNEQIVGPVHGHPLAFCGVVGPVTLPGRGPTALQGMADRLVADLDLIGWVGVDFLLDGDEIALLEVNPRPPASLALYGPDGGLVDAHVLACLQGRLPGAEAALALRPRAVQGLQHVFAPRALHLDDATLKAWSARAGLHDCPAAAADFPAGAPLCTLSASGETVAEVRARLAAAATALCAELALAPQHSQENTG